MSEAPTDPAGFSARIEQFTESMRIKNYSPETAKSARKALRQFAIWCAERGVLRPAEVTRPIIERYQRFLFHAINSRTDRPYSVSTQTGIINHIRMFFRWLSKQNLILYNPAADIDLPKQRRRLPGQFLTADEAERVMLQPNARTTHGLRDRAILETLYSTGMRRMEIRGLKIDELDFERGVAFIRNGKGQKDRVVPVGARACRWIVTYLHRSRPKLVCPPDDRTLFLSGLGRPLPTDRLSTSVAQYIRLAGIKKGGACHLFRHTCATLMLEGGADIRYVQEILGHSNLGTTELYTHVTIKKLKDVHTLTHPAAEINPEGETDEETPDEPDDDQEPDDKADKNPH